ncbi:RagB/SusD family nutrient uptake outer membrane protein [Flavivirga eckloniae]|uniref:RagB/SusD family nutrient uptake outer membrane protein n=1 Tax=Flavivirga eckloniae TaxID=1803846 RepID=A0A2K9PPG8_9FLAO|nr:RagB/SusD family nutrient uptake outer membrane protein [Flavivirga eckloniae]AUP78935.1 hypothetical protein C1H87_09570 [Flavivirga eckloniae]
MKKVLYILIAVPFLVISCQDDFIEKVDKNGLNSESFMQFESQAKEAVTSIYDPLTHYGMYNWGFMILGEAPTDNIENDWGDGSWGPHVVNIHNFNWEGSNTFIVRRWNSCYKGIARANFVLENLDKVQDFSNESEDQLRGEALFLRALYYYNLVSAYGDVPLVISLLSPDEINNITKSPASEVWAQIDADLVEASSLLPTTYSADDLGRATRGAAFGLLSRVRLWTEDYAGAESAASSVEGLGYSLVSSEDYVKMFDGRMENSSESIFETQLVSGLGGLWNAHATEQSILMHIFPRLAWGDYMHPRRKGTYDIVDIFETGDIRRQASILIPFQDELYSETLGELRTFPDTDTHPDFRSNILNDEVYQMRKFISNDDNLWGGGDGFREGVAINIPVIRYAEVILNKAEALVEQNKLPEAYAELERIRTRAGLDMTGISASDQSALRDQIKKDRRIELIFEGHRWGDLKRWDDLSKITDAGLSYAGQIDYPIPSQELDINPNLGN